MYSAFRGACERLLRIPHDPAPPPGDEASARVEDNAWILELAASEKCIVGFVGHLLPQEPDFAKHLKRFAANPIFRGIRVSNDDFLAHVNEPDFRHGITLLADAGLSLDVNGPPELHPALARLAAEVPALRIVVDHVGGAGDPARLTAEWRAGIRALGRQRNVYCKISALLEQTALSRTQWGKAQRDTSF